MRSCSHVQIKSCSNEKLLNEKLLKLEVVIIRSCSKRTCSNEKLFKCI